MLADKVIIVTGAASGIGRETARQLSDVGATVLCADLDLAGAEETASPSPRSMRACRVDVTDADDVDRMVAQAVELGGGLDGLFANAGINGGGTLFDVTPEDWDRVLRVNLTSVWLCVRAAARAMIERGGGSIVHAASVAGITGIRATASYTASKGGVVALARQFAVDLAPHGIRVNAVCPGLVPTPLSLASRQRISDVPVDVQLEQLAQGYPLGRLGETADVARLAAFLLSDQSGWITGAVIPVDGGLTARGA